MSKKGVCYWFLSNMFFPDIYLTVKFLQIIGELVLSGDRLSAGRDEKVLEMDGGYECKPCEYI